MEEYFLALVRGDKRGCGPALQRGGLRLLSAPYGWAVGVRNWLYDRGWKKIERAPVPVVSVGNLTLGGTGKTPCVEYVARFYRSLGLRAAILSRGYGADAGRNDEALVLEDNVPDVPHLQGADRVALARTAVEELDSEVLVLDDGFQHRRLHRDLDLVLIDATVPWGHGYLFPRGLLREPLRGMRRAGVIMLTRCDLAGPEAVGRIRAQVKRLAPGTPLVETTHQPAAWVNASKQVRQLNELRGRRVAGFCGIGNPEAFRRTLAKLDLDVAAWRTFPDHHRYTKDDIESLRAWARQLAGEAILVTTQKDLVKVRLDRLGDRDVWALQIQLQVNEGMEVLEEALKRVMSHWSNE